MKSPDKICDEHSNKGIRLSVDKLDSHYILIEGSASSLEYLGKLLLAQARFKKDCSFFISPKGPGSLFFEKGSKYGLYIHCLPCLEVTDKRRSGRLANLSNKSRSINKKHSGA